MSPLRTAVRAVLDWPAESQQRSRRNALLASTAMAQVRRERLDVDEFLDLHHRRWLARNGAGEAPPAEVPRGSFRASVI